MTVRITPDAQRYLADKLSLDEELTDAHLPFLIQTSNGDALHIGDDEVLDLTEAQALVGSRELYGIPAKGVLDEQAQALAKLATRTKDPVEARELRSRALQLHLFIARERAHPDAAEVAQIAAAIADPDLVAELTAKGISPAAARLYAAVAAADTPRPSNDDEARAIAFVCSVLAAWRVPDGPICVALLQAFPPGKGAREALLRTSRAMPQPVTPSAVETLRRNLESMPRMSRYDYCEFFAAGGGADEARSIDDVAKKQKPKDRDFCLRMGASLVARLRKLDASAITTERFQKALQFITESGRWGLADYIQQPSDLDDMSYPAVGALLARNLTLENCASVGWALDELHTSEERAGRHGDRIRAEFMSNAATPQLVRMLSRLDGYTSTFQQTLTELQRRDPTLVNALTEYEKAGGKIIDVAQGMIRFRALDALFAARDKVLQPTLQTIVEAPHMAGLAAPFLIQVLRQGSAEQQQQIEQWLYEQTMSRKNPGAFLLRTCSDAGALTNEILLQRAAQLPAPPDTNEVLKRLAEDGELVQYLFFYPDERSFYGTRDRLKKAGFSVARSEAKSLTLVRTVGGLKQTIHLTIDPTASRQNAFADPKLDLMGHRGHSYHLHETFPKGLTRDASLPPAVLYFGSCGAAGQLLSSPDVGELLNYAWIADENTGQGAINDDALVAFNDGLALGKRTWEGLLGRFKADGLLLPDDPAFGVARYEAELRKLDQQQAEGKAPRYLSYLPTEI